MQNSDTKTKKNKKYHELPTVVVFANEEKVITGAQVYLGHNELLLPEDALTAPKILMLVVKLHHVLRLYYDKDVEMLALIAELALGDFMPTETDCTPSKPLIAYIDSLRYLKLFFTLLLIFIYIFLSFYTEI